MRDGSIHNYAECANKGYCDRSTGECQCFPGYEGKGCGRQSCPANCSGRGTCQYQKDLTFGIVYNEYYDGSSLSLSGLGTGGKKFTEYTWDAGRSRSCVCDAGWTGLACDRRLCPMGNDILDVMPGFDPNSNVGLPGYGNEVAQVQTITLFDAQGNNNNFASKSFAIRFTSKMNETFVTQPIMWNLSDDILEGFIETALKELPNKVVDDVSVSIDSSNGANGVIINISFIGNSVQGKQYKVEVLTEPCKDGCTPRITGLTNLRTFSDTTLSTVEITTAGSLESYECGRRGKCDFSIGICKCFQGFTGEACNFLSALA